METILCSLSVSISMNISVSPFIQDRDWVYPFLYLVCWFTIVDTEQGPKKKKKERNQSLSLTLSTILSLSSLSSERIFFTDPPHIAAIWPARVSLSGGQKFHHHPILDHQQRVLQLSTNKKHKMNVCVRTKWKKNSRNKKKHWQLYQSPYFFTSKGIADNVDLPNEKTGIRRTLELDLECAIVPVCIGPRVGDIGNFERRNYKSICLVIS